MTRNSFAILGESRLSQELLELSRGAGLGAVLISDLADSDNITAAFRIGINGFLPTDTPPDIAFKALTFILNGGDFFPPSALQTTRRNGPSASAL